MFDTIWLPCPRCGKKAEAQSKGGECLLRNFEFPGVPEDVLSDVNRHAPFYCECGCVFKVALAPTIVELDA